MKDFQNSTIFAAIERHQICNDELRKAKLELRSTIAEYAAEIVRDEPATAEDLVILALSSLTRAGINHKHLGYGTIRELLGQKTSPLKPATKPAVPSSTDFDKALAHGGKF